MRDIQSNDKPSLGRGFSKNFYTWCIVRCVKLSPDNRHLATGCNNPITQIYELGANTLVSILIDEEISFPERDCYIEGICFSADSRLLVTASADYLVRVSKWTTFPPFIEISMCMRKVLHRWGMFGIMFGIILAIISWHTEYSVKWRDRFRDTRHLCTFSVIVNQRLRSGKSVVNTSVDLAESFQESLQSSSTTITPRPRSRRFSRMKSTEVYAKSNARH